LTCFIDREYDELSGIFDIFQTTPLLSVSPLSLASLQRKIPEDRKKLGRELLGFPGNRLTLQNYRMPIRSEIESVTGLINDTA
jgi:hypothetical protein